MLQATAIDHIVIRCHDLERMVAFYSVVLGLEVIHRQDKLRLVHLRVGDGLIDLVAADSATGRGGIVPGAARNLDHVCLRVAAFDASAIRVHLARFGVAASEPGDRYGAGGQGLSLYFDDPEGNRVELRG